MKRVKQSTGISKEILKMFLSTTAIDDKAWFLSFLILTNFFLSRESIIDEKTISWMNLMHVNGRGINSQYHDVFQLWHVNYSFNVLDNPRKYSCFYFNG